MKKSKSEQRRLQLMAQYAARAGMPGAPLIEIPDIKEPKFPFNEEELEKLETFPEDKEGRKAKRKYVKELETKYRQK